MTEHIDGVNEPESIMLTTVTHREVLIQVGGYVGIPAALEGTRVAESVLNEMAEKEGYKRELP